MLWFSIRLYLKVDKEAEDLLRRSQERSSFPRKRRKIKIYVKDADEEKLIEVVRHLDTLKRANLFSPKDFFTSMKVIYQKGLNSLLESICILLRVFNTVPDSVAEGERSFGPMKAGIFF